MGRWSTVEVIVIRFGFGCTLGFTWLTLGIDYTRIYRRFSRFATLCSPHLHSDSKSRVLYICEYFRISYSKLRSRFTSLALCLPHGRTSLSLSKCALFLHIYLYRSAPLGTVYIGTDDRGESNRIGGSGENRGVTWSIGSGWRLTGFAIWQPVL